MLDSATGVLVAVSGGPDSVALLDMLLRLVSEVGDEQVASSSSIAHVNPQPSNPHLHIAHLDHQLRDRESAEDAEFVRALANRLGIGFTFNSIDVRAAARGAGRGVEETAREIRYDFLRRAADETGCNRIAVGHTMTDQAETFVMRLIRGAGTRGLAAMRPALEAHEFSNERAEEQRGGGAEEQRSRGAEEQRSAGAREQRGRRAEEQRSGGAREQRSEAAEEEQRSRGAEEQRGGGAEGGRGAEEQRSFGAEVRPSAPPHPSPSAPQPLSPSAPQPLCTSAHLLIRPLLCITREEVEAYCRERKLEFRTDLTNQDSRYTRNRIRNEVMPAMTAINPRIVESIARAAENLASDQDVLDSVSSELLRIARIECTNGQIGNLDGNVAYSATALLNQPSGMRRRMIVEALRIARIDAGEVSSTHVENVEALLLPEASGKRISLPGGLEAWREFDRLVIKCSVVDSGEYQIAISSADPVARAGNINFTLQRGAPGALLSSVIEATQRERERMGLDWMSVALLDGVVPERLIIRPRRSGERAHVIGQRKTKKLKNLMIDHRIPSSRRANWPIVTTPDGRYVWSPGLPPALEFTARDESQCVAVLRASVI